MAFLAPLMPFIQGAGAAIGAAAGLKGLFAKKPKAPGPTRLPDAEGDALNKRVAAWRAKIAAGQGRGATVLTNAMGAPGAAPTQRRVLG